MFVFLQVLFFYISAMPTAYKEPLHMYSFGDLRYAKDVATVCAGIIWISAFCDLCLLTSNACPTKKLHHKAINVRSSSFIWLSDHIEECRTLQKQNAENKLLCVP